MWHKEFGFGDQKAEIFYIYKAIYVLFVLIILGMHIKPDWSLSVANRKDWTLFP